MLHVLQHLLLRRCVALELVGDDYPWHQALFFQEVAFIIALLPSCHDAVAAKHPARSLPNPLPATNSIAVF